MLLDDTTILEWFLNHILLPLGNAMLVKIRKMKSLADDDEVADTQESSSSSSGASKPAWMRALYNNVNNWLKILPEVSLILIILKVNQNGH